MAEWVRAEGGREGGREERVDGGRYIRNSSGPRTVPWDTPDVTGLASDDIPPKTTVCSRSVRKAEIHPRVVPITPIASSFFSRCLCATMSNAFEKSNKMASV